MEHFLPWLKFYPIFHNPNFYSDSIGTTISLARKIGLSYIFLLKWRGSWWQRQHFWVPLLYLGHGETFIKASRDLIVRRVRRKLHLLGLFLGFGLFDLVLFLRVGLDINPEIDTILFRRPFKPQLHTLSGKGPIILLTLIIFLRGFISLIRDNSWYPAPFDRYVALFGVLTVLASLPRITKYILLHG